MENKPNIDHNRTPHYDEDEIDLIALAKTLWAGRKTIIKTTIIFACIGLFVALTTPAQYTSTVVVKPILSDAKANISGSLGGLAAMAGINLGSSSASAEIHPTLYPKIVESYKFQKELMQTLIYVSELNKEVTFEKYYTEIYRPSILGYIKRYTIDLPAMFLKFLSSEKERSEYNIAFYRITEKDKELLKILSSQLDIIVDENDGSVSLYATMPENIQAAQVVEAMQSILQREVITHKMKKAKEDLAFIEDRFKEKKKEFEFAQNNLAKYRDANKNVSTAIALTEVERLESEYQLSFSVYSELAKQVEAQKIQVKENTPVFAVLQGAVVQIDRSSKSKIVIGFIWIVLGGVISISVVTLTSIVSKFKVKLKND